MDSPRPWVGLGALVGVVGVLLWVPSWGLSGALAPVGLVCVALGLRSARRRWLVWLALALNVLLLIGAVLLWWPP